MVHGRVSFPVTVLVTIELATRLPKVLS